MLRTGVCRTKTGNTLRGKPTGFDNSLDKGYDRKRGM